MLRHAPFDLPAGSFRSEDQELIVRADATVVTADQVRGLTIRDTVEIGDVAEVYFGAEDAQSYVREGGRRVLGLGIVRQARISPWPDSPSRGRWRARAWNASCAPLRPSAIGRA